MPDELSPEAVLAVHKAASAAQAVEISRTEQLNTALGRHEETIITAVNDNYINIMTTLATLIAGQNATNSHLLILNGKVAAHEKELTVLMLWKAELRGAGAAISVGWSVLLVLLSGAGVSIFYWLFNK